MDLQYRFCKRILKVSDRATNWAAMSECGRLPTMIQIISKMTSYWYHLSISNSPIVKAALQTNADLARKGRRCWYFYIQRCFRFLDIEHILYTSDIREVKLKLNKVKSLLTFLAISNWHSTLSENCNQEGGQLNLFYSIKRDIGVSPFLALPYMLYMEIGYRKIPRQRS